MTFERKDVLKAEDNQTGMVIQGIKKLPFTRAIITYEYKGWQTGKEVVYLDAEKNKIAIESSWSSNFAGFIQKHNTFTLYDGKIGYECDLEKNEAIKTEEMSDIFSMFNEALYLSQKPRKEVFLNKDCKVYQHFSGKGQVYFWEGILLKEESLGHPMGDKYNYTKEAVDVQLDVTIPVNKFELPKDIQITTWEEKMGKWGEENKKWEEEGKKWVEQEKQHYQELAEKDPEMKKVLENATREDGTLDMNKSHQLMQEKRRKEVIEEAEGLEGGERLVQEATSKDGVVDVYKLQSFIWEKKREKREKYFETENMSKKAAVTEQKSKKLALEQGWVDQVVLSEEDLSVSNLQMLCTGFESYRNNEKTYPKDLTELINAKPPYINAFWDKGVYMYKGYKVEVVESGRDSYLIVAYPDVSFSSKSSDSCSFCIMEDGIVRVDREGKCIENCESCRKLARYEKIEYNGVISEELQRIEK